MRKLAILHSLKKFRYAVIFFISGCLLVFIITFLININFDFANYFFPDTPSPNGEILKIILQVFGGIAIIISLWLTNKRVKAMTNSNILIERGNVSERFKTAIEHLGSNNSAIRLGGIYALHHIAKDDETYKTTVFDILCSYVREITCRPKVSISKADKRRSPSIAIQTILDLLFGESSNIYEGLRADLTGANLTGADLHNAKLSLVNLFKVDLTGANLNNADLTGVNLTGADLSETTLAWSNLIATDLTEANLTGANLTGANLTEANLTGAILTDTFFTGADLTGADLSRTALYDVDLSSASNIHKAKLHVLYSILHDIK